MGIFDTCTCQLSKQWFWIRWFAQGTLHDTHSILVLYSRKNCRLFMDQTWLGHHYHASSKILHIERLHVLSFFNVMKILLVSNANIYEQTSHFTYHAYMCVDVYHICLHHACTMTRFSVQVVGHSITKALIESRGKSTDHLAPVLKNSIQVCNGLQWTFIH